MTVLTVPAPQQSAGFSLVELVFALGLAAVLSAIALASVAGRADEIASAGAARHVAALLQRTRAEAIARNTSVGVDVTVTSSSHELSTIVDGDGDGVLKADVDAGIDISTGPVERLADRFAGVRFGALPGLPAIDPTGTAPGTDPIRLGAADIAVFTPMGTATSGTLYLLGRGRQQYAVRIFGETGRTRVLRFNAATATWRPLAQ